MYLERSFKELRESMKPLRTLTSKVVLFKYCVENFFRYLFDAIKMLRNV